MAAGVHETLTRASPAQRRASRPVAERDWAPPILRLQQLAGNRACQRLIVAGGPATSPLLRPVDARTVGHAVTVLRQAEDEADIEGGDASSESVCGLEVKGRGEGQAEEKVEPLARSAEAGLVTVRDTGKVGAGDATVVCDGKGAFRVALGMYENFPCGVTPCVKKHEQSHIADIKKDVPNACKSKGDGATPDVFVDDPEKWKRDTECKAHKIELSCLNKTKGATGCGPVLKRMKDKTRKAQAQYCG